MSTGPEPFADFMEDLGSEPPTDWPRPMPLAIGTRPPIPLEALPDPLPDFLRTTSASLACEPDLVAMPTLATLSMGLNGRATILARGEGENAWTQGVNLYVAAVARSGEYKSPAENFATAPIRQWEEAEQERQAPQIARQLALRDAEQKRLSKLKTNFANSKPDSAAHDRLKADIAALTEQLDAEGEPVLPRYLMEDATPAAQGVALSHHRWLGLFSTEGIGPLQILAGRHSAQGQVEAELFNKAHTQESHVVDRIRRGIIVIYRPSLVVSLMVQPEALEGLANYDQLKDLGALARVMWAYPVSQVGHRPAHLPEPDGEIIRAYHNVVRDLLSLPRVDPRARGDQADPPALRLHPDAYECFVAYRAELEPLLAVDGRLEFIAPWVAKLRTSVIRLSAVLYAAQRRRDLFRDPVIPAEMMERAVTIGRYWQEHALAVFSIAAADPRLGRAQKVGRWIQKHCTRTQPEFEHQRAWQATKGGALRSVADLDQALELLAENFWVRPKPINGTSRKGFWVNPQLLEEGQC